MCDFVLPKFHCINFRQTCLKPVFDKKNIQRHVGDLPDLSLHVKIDLSCLQHVCDRLLSRTCRRLVCNLLKTCCRPGRRHVLSRFKASFRQDRCNKIVAIPGSLSVSWQSRPMCDSSQVCICWCSSTLKSVPLAIISPATFTRYGLPTAT